MLHKKVEFPGELCFIEREPAGNRMFFESRVGSSLNLRNEIDSLLLILITLILLRGVVIAKQLPVTEIFLNNHSALAVNRINFGYRYRVIEKQAGDVEIRMEVGIEWFGVYGSDGGSLLPGNAEVVACGSVRGQRDNGPIAIAVAFQKL